MRLGWRQLVATRFRHAKRPNLNKDFRTAPFVIRHFPTRPLSPKSVFICVYPWLKESSRNRFSHFYYHFCYSDSGTDTVPLGLNYP